MFGCPFPTLVIGGAIKVCPYMLITSKRIIRLYMESILTPSPKIGVVNMPLEIRVVYVNSSQRMTGPFV